MIIGIDASRAFLQKRTGIEEYSYQIIKHLRNELAKEQVVLYVRKKQVIDFEIPAMWRVRTLGWFRLWTQGKLALEMFFHSPDALFVPAHTVPWIHPKETIVTVHGLEYEFCPEAYSWWERIYMRWSIRNSCRWASRIVAVSENTKKDLISLYRVPEEKIKVIYEGVSCFKLRANNNQCESNSKHQIPKPYFLFIGRIELRKNVARMIGAFDVFKKKCGTNHKLVLAGKPGYGYEAVAHQVAHAKYRNDIVELGYILEEEKWELLQNADGFLFPSLYEGFGLPVLEAQAVGVPVLTSTTSSLPEVTCHVARERRDEEPCAIFVHPESAEDIARGIEKLALDKGFRSAIIESGSRNVARFSWEKCAQEVAEMLTGK